MKKVISTRQPWAFLIIRPDIADPALRAEAARNGIFKDCENRTWRTNYRGQLYIHASQKPDPEIDLIREAMREIGIEIPHDLDYGAIIGHCNLVDCVNYYESFWFNEGSYAFVLDDPEPVEPIKTKGRLGIWSA